VVAQNEFKGHTANLINLRIIRDDHHPIRNRRAAGRMKFFLIFNPDQAYATSTL
jgi:hypothetical protein